jgi:hypothetical protein
MKTPGWFQDGAVVAVLLTASMVWAQAGKPTLVPYPLDSDPNPVVKRSEEALRTVWHEVLRDRAGVIVPSRKEVDAAFIETRRQDCRESNECLAQLALKAGTLYALYASLEYTARKQVVLVGRVVRDDGKLMAAGRVELPRGQDALVDVFRVLLARLVEQLGVKDLPTFKEVVKPAPPVVVPPPPERVVTAAPAPMPSLEEVRNPVRVVGYVAVGAGAVAAGVGAIVFAGAPAVRFEGTNVVAADKALVADAQAKQRAGVVLMAVGGAVAAAGGLLWVLAPQGLTRVAVTPLAGGGVLTVGGTFP